MKRSFLLLVPALGLLGACALFRPVAQPAATAPAASSPAVAEAAPQPGVPTPAAMLVADGGVPVAVNADGEELGEDEEEVDDEGPSPEAESHEIGSSDGSLRYTADLSEAELQQLWRSSPEKLGSISFGFVDEGRLLNAVQFPEDTTGAWTRVSPELAWGTQETIDYVVAAIKQVKAQFPNAPPLRVNQISAREGGYLRPHKSHQNGRDVDLAFYYPTADPIRARNREKYIDVAKNWALLKALVTMTDVQFVLVDKRVQKVLYDHALKIGEDKAWLDSVFKAGRASAVMHARRHRDHFHVRFYNARAQELGRRVAPLLAERPEQNVAMHRVRSGDTLSRIAQKYGSSVAGLRKANRLKSNFLRLSQVLRVPLRGPCTHCPVPPAVVLPARRVAPGAPPAVAASPALTEPLAASPPPSPTPVAVEPAAAPLDFARGERGAASAVVPAAATAPAPVDPPVAAPPPAAALPEAQPAPAAPPAAAEPTATRPGV